MGTYFDGESGTYRSFENAVISLLKTIAGEPEEEPVVEEEAEAGDIENPEIATGEDRPDGD